jgi:integrase
LYLRKRKGKWQVEIKKIGFPRKIKTFLDKKIAIKWARDIEMQMERGMFEDYTRAGQTTLKDLLIKYRDEITIKKKGVKSETYKINFLIRHNVSELNLMQLNSSHLYTLKNELATNRATKTVNDYLHLIRHIWNTAKKVWSIQLPAVNPVTLVSMEKVKNYRDVVLTPEEFRVLVSCASVSPLKELEDLIVVAYYTGARFSEINNLKKSDVNLDKKIATFMDTKTGDDRTIPLSKTVIEVLKKYMFREVLFNVNYENFRHYFQVARKKADLEHFRFHDLRACFITRMLQAGMPIVEVASITGHSNWKTISRYTRIKPESLSSKLDELEMGLVVQLKKRNSP